MKLFSVCPVLLMTVSLVSTEDEAPTVQTKSGLIRGFLKTSFHGRKYRAFQGIPYAKPPVGKLRFQPPEQINPWENELSATKQYTMCMQFSSHPIGSEDCLYLNIFAPILPRNSSVPVIFYIFGGVFKIGSISQYGPEYLLDRDVIFVLCSFRLGVLGFLSTEDDVVPGNMGLKDQSLALRWVSENIGAFGGDPNRITICGHSSGGFSSHSHYLSPWSRGLFRNGLSLSDSSMKVGGIMKNPLKKTQMLATHLHCPTASNKALIACLRSRSAGEILNVQSMIEPQHDAKSPAIFGPVVEKGGVRPFLNATPMEILSSGQAADVPWITGVVRDEGLVVTAAFATNETLMKLMNDRWDFMAPLLFNFENIIPKENYSSMARLIREHYLGSDPISMETFGPITSLFGDGTFKFGVEKAARAQATVNKSPVWFYNFDYEGMHTSNTKFWTGSDKYFGICHADDLSYYFNITNVKTGTFAEETPMREFMLDFIVSYATNGTPSVGVEWPKIDPTSEDLQYLHIKGPKNVSVEKSANFAEKNVWNTIESAGYDFQTRNPHVNSRGVRCSVISIVLQFFLFYASGFIFH